MCLACAAVAGHVLAPCATSASAMPGLARVAPLLDRRCRPALAIVHGWLCNSHQPVPSSREQLHRQLLCILWALAIGAPYCALHLCLALSGCCLPPLWVSALALETCGLARVLGAGERAGCGWCVLLVDALGERCLSSGALVHAYAFSLPMLILHTAMLVAFFLAH